MRKKIILGIVILAVIVGAVYFNKNYAIVKVGYGAIVVHIDAARIGSEDWDETVNCTPSLKKLTKLERLQLRAEENMDLNNLSEMKKLNELTIYYFDGYYGRLDTLPDLPNIKYLRLIGDVEHKNIFTFSDNIKYNFSNINTIELWLFDEIDINALEHFENLHDIKILRSRKDLILEEQIEELQKKGIDVEFI
ncbi:MAG: hypothetical protein K2K44_02870 [Oscillospiraceae bacterium]|nr:hypothetical protein [Oscillospiraceae bacterium]